MATPSELIFKGELAALMLKHRVVLDSVEGQVMFIGPNFILRLERLSDELDS